MSEPEPDLLALYAQYLDNGGHRHRDAVTFPDGTTVTAVSFDPRAPYERDGSAPAFGLYFDPVWQPPWPHARIDWPDFGVPADRDALLHALDDLAGRARRGERVELGCLGGHGRTGTALAVLATVCGVTDDLVGWVRRNYCASAVETDAQERFVTD